LILTGLGSDEEALVCVDTLGDAWALHRSLISGCMRSLLRTGQRSSFEEEGAALLTLRKRMRCSTLHLPPPASTNLLLPSSRRTLRLCAFCVRSFFPLNFQCGSLQVQQMAFLNSIRLKSPSTPQQPSANATRSDEAIHDQDHHRRQ